mmetsp:Transcript_30231/g.50798  ORF Transcript_30231/g.50798 Transcript_30231/m.50798 type:complete len:503 (+) Transcript_30231:6-1514(+)
MLVSFVRRSVTASASITARNAAVQLGGSFFGAKKSLDAFSSSSSAPRRSYAGMRGEDLDNIPLKPKETDIPEDTERTKKLLPREIVAELDRFIVGQSDAKKAVAVAMRNRFRRKLLSPEFSQEIVPKNILMIGPTGVGKTEIARRLAKLSGAPFLKVEATKFTEVGFHGRDVDQIIRDLVEVGIQLSKAKMRAKIRPRIEKDAEEKLLDMIAGEDSKSLTRETFRTMLKDGLLNDREVEIDITSDSNTGPDSQPNIEMLMKMLHTSRSRRVKMTVKEAIPFIIRQEGDKLINQDAVLREAIELVEQEGIVFIDEIDKICTPAGSGHSRADASAEGVQRDLLPLIEGSTVSTKHGNIDTSKILFIASGAFYSAKPSDLLAELQGRLPIRVELTALDEKSLYKILTEPEFNLIKQQIALMKTEGIDLQFQEDAIKEIAHLAAEINSSIENIGARRLHTVIERIVEEISFDCDKHSTEPVVITAEDVKTRLLPMLKKMDLGRYIL